MTIIDRYLCKKIILGFLITFASFFFLYIIIDLFTSLQDFLKNKTSAELILQYYILTLPTIFVQITPLSFLLTSLYTIGMLNKSNEMVSLRTQGLSPSSIASIFMIFALLISIFSLYIDDKIVPVSAIKIEKLNIKETDNIDKQQDIIKNFHFYTKSGNVVFARKYNTKTNVLSNVNIFFQDSKGIAYEEMLAQEVFYEQDFWIARNATVYTIKDGIVDIEDAKHFSTTDLDFTENPKDIVRRAKLQWTDLSLKDIRKQIKSFSKWRAKTIVKLLTVEFHRKIAQNFALFFLLLGSLPFCMRIQQRRVGMSAIALTISLCFGYYFLFSLCVALGKSDFFEPAISCWMANIFFGVSGITGMFTVK